MSKTALTREVVETIAVHYGMPELLDEDGKLPNASSEDHVEGGYGEFLWNCMLLPQFWEPTAEDFEEWIREVADEITGHDNPPRLYSI